MNTKIQRCTSLALGIVLVSGIAAAQVPQQMSYQGLITTSAGQPVPDGTYSLTFRIYEGGTGGTAIWVETQPNVQVRRGLFNVILGSVNPFNVPFDRQYWIGTTIGSGSEIAPRTALTAAPYSIRSRNADSADAIAVNSVGTENVRDGAITLNKLSAAGSSEGQVLTSTGTGLVWSSAAAAGVASFNGQSGAITLNAAGGLILTRNGNQFTLTGPTGVSSINSADAAIGITNPTGPAVTLSINPFGITEPLLADDAISTRKLRDGAVTGAKIASGAISASNIADGAITGIKLAPNAVTTDKILDGSVQNADLANSSITINAGTGLAGGGIVPLGGTVSLSNAGVTSITGTANQINVSSATGAVTLSTPQDIAQTSSPTFQNLALTGKATSASTVSGDPGTTLVTKDFLTAPGSVAVSTDATLQGNGLAATPLGLNLGNANTWTATQSFATTPAQGDAFIASTNAGTTTINAPRIGAGLTDAQVNDNLTIAAGTIDNTPIGATTPNTGAFTTINGTSISLTGKGTSASTIAADPGNTLVTKDFVTTAGNVAVTTNASLTGNGTTLSPLGINLANANTYTATQTFPATAAQGDALIGSTNAGTTTINAARIGAGLTDAQVNDNLAIIGGTIDNTPIGATTPNTGAFTTINGASISLTGKGTSASTIAADPGNTLVTKDFVTTAGNVAVTTNTSLTGNGTTLSPLGINLANANTFSATQTLPTTATQGDALIASTNAGTTTINAARIGNGLTDVQVNDNLTIVAGTINNTPIGATTPNTGAFTTINGASLALTGKGTSASTVAADPGNTLLTKDFVTTAGNVAVTTNTSLVGDGTTASPLGINLANANTFTATQTLPATAAQGDALIASTNAGTTTINAARIGAGLTDAQVNDNLTINGGTVDATPVGATTPSTGAFTTLSGTAISGTSLALTGKGTSASTVAADPGNTLLTKDFVTNAGNVAVTTNTSLVGDGTTASPLGINLANANTFTATQTLPATAAQGDALIASTNAGTTTITDARVADNLTVNGGVIDATPIGATTPSTGAFTTINGTSMALTAKATSASTVTADPGNTLVTKDFVTSAGNVAVSTNASLVGDGTTASPLGINLANANTFTATQSLPVTAAQGDALIASTNAGTTTIDAARIGAGLTDAQVNDNLTINGGTVDATPVGATTPSTGAFTTINGTSMALTAKGTSASTVAADPGNTLVTKDFVTSAGNVAVSTNASLVGDGTTASPLGINLANANTFTATQTLPATAAQGDALIASTNAGTTTIDAARIGAGLTDAQVNDNLTINGGTIDATPIGATTPSTGAFTTLAGTAISGTSLGLTAKATSASTVAADPGNTLVTKDFVTSAGNVAVSTNASLVGDGTTASPLGINLANANTFTATQTLPATAAQGDALIASTNAGTTTIDAARIGAGLTDAQVNDNLTINGGTVDATPVGATTPSTGAFTTINGTSMALTAKGTSASTVAADPGNTLVTKDFVTSAGNVAVTTNTSLVGDGTTASPLGINLANANTFTATQTLPATAAQGDALIASTNAGTTTITDARVADNLTVNGGVIDATPIGATTPSTGAFTTINGTSMALTAKATSASTVAADPGNTLVTKDFVTSAGNVAVSTNASLVGDGTTATPLGINLANANTFTATQTLPATAAQGDALIASTNAGTTTIDAARIGAGLTDAQVNDNLTINGGTIDATPIGATTPSTGTFTAITGTALPAASTSGDIVVSNAGALETRTIASLGGSVAVTTDATLTGDGTTATPLGINLANANTFTATQTLPVTAAQGDALIASTNAGTTTIDAARIGAGLTDAQVNDNLTINGGTVDATPVGATTPSTGAFTTITGTSMALTAKATSASTVAADPGNTLVTKDFVTSAGNVAISTDATLTGDGTTATPLGINLANANTFTATQTLPVTAAQGDALIASTNAGTTTIDAARIGAGLTDAQVNDNLTINGGTIDATPVGATTPSTGAFTTITGTAIPAASTSSDIVVSNGGALETRTIASLSGTVGVSTDATLTGDGTTATPLALNLANANTFTATQTLPVTAAQGDALIASTNAGTTTIDAARIGAGLTDAQVNDNLTINGGTIDATAIGATTPSTGAFTTITGTAIPAASTSTDIVVSNGGALETRTAASLAGAFSGNVAVSTDATLTGDGTTATPLGLNLANANTFTATQTLPVTAAQGDALIASTNAGTTTIDAARIGAGLTDAQVNDNLTINGGTIDATPIGATTPSTGAFTTITGTAIPAASTSSDIVVSNGGALETRTIASLSGTVGVSTDATLTGDGTTATPLALNLANANTFTATQTLPVTAAQGDALIASTNAGTTTIDAARIGAGLTDAQVNDNLTINGGTIDATPIGATTESTGRFTTSEATTVLGAATTPAAGTTYRDNVVIAWGDIAAAGVVNDQFGNAVVAHTPGTGVYTITLPNAPTAASTIVTLQTLGLNTVTRAGAVLTVTTYDITGTPTDLDFYFQTVGRP